MNVQSSVRSDFMELKHIDWTKRFEEDSDRYLKTYNKERRELVEVYDKRSGKTWVRVNDKWMCMND